MSQKSKIPQHVAIIMDGNGRWARERGKERSYGHVQGVESVRTVLKAARNRGISFLTLYVFSTENWGRPQEEVDMLMELFCSSVLNEMDELREQGVRVKIIGRRDKMPAKVQESLRRIEEHTSANDTITLLLALNYSSREEIVDGVRTLAARVAQGQLKPEEISPQSISDSLYTAHIPEPDLVIRTGGEVRLSNFLLWQAAYSELYFTEVYWPDFDAAELDKALEVFAARDRRFGKLNDDK